RAQQRLVIGIGNLRPVQRQRGDATRIDIELERLIAHDVVTFAGSVLAPQTRTPTRAPGGGTKAPDSSAASAVAPPGSAISRSRSQRRRCAAAIASSATSTASTT